MLYCAFLQQRLKGGGKEMECCTTVLDQLKPAMRKPAALGYSQHK